jgi:hypothetical protein
MALEGTLRDFSFADILQLISLQRKTGVLTLKHEDKLVTISFLDGCIVGSSSLNQHTEDRIGLILLKRGEITEAELEAALKRQEETLQRLGRILIDHHVVSPETVREALEQQILQIVFRVFRWADGEYHFSQETDIDYDRDLMRPMAADSIIMEGARMTDEWPFIDQRIPDRKVVFIKTDPNRKFDVVEQEDEDFDDLGFNFTESPEETASASVPEDRVTSQQLTVYELVNGTNNVREIILESPLIEFETCKALADLVDRGVIREASQDEVARRLARDVEPVKREPRTRISLPWLAVPAALLLFLGISFLPSNPSNIGLSLRPLVWDRFVLETVSWQRMGQLSRAAEAHFFLHGLYPQGAADLQTASLPLPLTDPWKRPYRLAAFDDQLSVTGTDASGNPAGMMTLTRKLAWEGDATQAELRGRPGVRLLD